MKVPNVLQFVHSSISQVSLMLQFRCLLALHRVVCSEPIFSLIRHVRLAITSHPIADEYAS